MTHPRTADLRAILDVLLEAHVELIVIGGAAAILHGAATSTLDLDIVHRRDPANVERLLAALAGIDAFVREPADRRLRPSAELLTRGHQPLFSTALGPLDALCVLHDGRGYEELLPHTDVMSDGGRSLRVLDLDTLIEVKAAANRPKDRLVLPILLVLRDEKARSRRKGPT